MSDGSTILDKPEKHKQAAFLAAYAECGTVTHAARAAAVDRTTHYWWMNNDPDYRPLFLEAHEKSKDALVREARRRAVNGWREPVFHEGMVCGYKRKFSDTLLIFLMKGEIPEKFSDRVVQGEQHRHLHYHDHKRLTEEEHKRRSANLRQLLRDNGEQHVSGDGPIQGNGDAC